jgi:hypothetical protein
MKHILVPVAFIVLFAAARSHAQVAEEYDSSAIARIIDEGTKNSQVMEMLGYLTDVYGPRLSWSPGYKRSAEWTRQRLASMGLQNAHVEGWEPLGRGWEIRHYSANVIGRQVFPLHSYPKAWSPGIEAKGDVILLDATTDSALATYKGKLKGKYVLLGGVKKVNISFEPLAKRHTDIELLDLANSDAARARRPRRTGISAEFRQRSILEYERMQMCEKEGALALLSPGSFDGGSIMVLSASIPQHPDTPRANRARIWDLNVPKILPQIAVGVEHYNRMVRMMEKGEKIRIDMKLDIAHTGPDSGYNVLAEIAGSDLKDEVVMIGAHLDSWHGSTGATDNAAGVAICMEAMRILKTLGLQPRRTIRIGLWGGEELGELGAKAYVAKHLGRRSADSSAPVRYTPAGEKFSVYFNDDNGTGRFRGIYTERNEAVRPIFRSWFVPFGKPGSFTVSFAGTTNTDHQQFDNIGLPAFQFIQDEIEYFSRTWHSTMDFYDRAIEDDLKQNAVIMAGFAYNAAMREEKVPRKAVK